MLKLKKIVAMVVAVCMMMATNVTIFATEQTSVREGKLDVVNLSDNISTETIEEITSAVGVFLLYDDGSVVEVDSTVIIEDEPILNSRSIDGDSKHSYRVTVSASVSEQVSTSNARKIVSDSSDKNGVVVASITLRMKWTDNFGLENVIDEVSGTLTVDKGTVSSGTVSYGNGANSAAGWTKKSVGASSSFCYKPNMIVADPSADYIVKFKESDVALGASVSSSIFQ